MARNAIVATALYVHCMLRNGEQVNSVKMQP